MPRARARRRPRVAGRRGGPTCGAEARCAASPRARCSACPPTSTSWPRRGSSPPTGSRRVGGDLTARSTRRPATSPSARCMRDRLGDEAARAAGRPAGRRHQRRRHRPAQPGGHRAAARRGRPQRRRHPHRGLPGAARRGHRPQRAGVLRAARRAWARSSTRWSRDLDARGVTVEPGAAVGARARRAPAGRSPSTSATTARRSPTRCSLPTASWSPRRPGGRRSSATAAPRAATLLAAIPYASVALVSLAVPRDAIDRELDGSGFLVPRVEGRTVTACSWTSSKWPHLAGDGTVWLRASVGRDGDEAALALADDELVAAVLADLARHDGAARPPVEVRVSRWHRSFPQYRPGHLDRVDAIEAELAAATPHARGRRRRPARPRRARLHPPGRRRRPPRPRRPRRLTRQPVATRGANGQRSASPSHPSSPWRAPSRNLVALRASRVPGRYFAPPSCGGWTAARLRRDQVGAGRIQSSVQGSRGSAARSTVGSMRRAAGRPLRLTQASTRTSTSCPRRSLVGRDGEGGLVDQVGLGGHHPELGRACRAGSGRPPSVRPGRRLVDEERHRSRLLDEQHVPREAVALARPAVIARVGEVPQRQGELDDDPQPRPSTSSTGDATHATGPVAPRSARPRPGEEPARPVGLEEHRGRADHQPGEHADREQRPGAHVEHHQHEPGRQPRPPPQQQRHDRGSRTAAPATAKAWGDGLDAHQPPRAPARRRGPGATARAAAPARSQSAWSLARPAKA